VAGVLCGRFNPSGRLPVTFPRRTSDIPTNTTAQWPGVDGTATYSEGIFVGYRHYDARNITPLFPFGHGLSYTSFAYSNLRITPVADGNVTVELDVRNTGSRSGGEIVQLYVGSPSTTAVPEAPKELAGFTKVIVGAGSTSHVTFTLTPRSFSHWDVATDRWVVTGGQHRIMVGASSRDVRLTGMIQR